MPSMLVVFLLPGVSWCLRSLTSQRCCVRKGFSMLEMLIQKAWEGYGCFWESFGGFPCKENSGKITEKCGKPPWAMEKLQCQRHSYNLLEFLWPLQMAHLLHITLWDLHGTSIKLRLLNAPLSSVSCFRNRSGSHFPKLRLKRLCLGARRCLEKDKEGTTSDFQGPEKGSYTPPLPSILHWDQHLPRVSDSSSLSSPLMRRKHDRRVLNGTRLWHVQEKDKTARKKKKSAKKLHCPESGISQQQVTVGLL